MAKSKGINSSKRVSGRSTRPQATSLIGASDASSKSTGAISASNDLNRLSTTTSIQTHGIEFGSPSESRSKSSSSSSGTDWGSLLKKTASGGISSLLGSGGLSIGINSIISGISSLFGGNDAKEPAPLVRFSLPDSQQKTVYSSVTGVSNSENSSIQSAGTSSASGGIYNSVGSGVGSAQLSSTQIVQAVKTALLTSSSLNDVISDL